MLVPFSSHTVFVNDLKPEWLNVYTREHLRDPGFDCQRKEFHQPGQKDGGMEWLSLKKKKKKGNHPSNQSGRTGNLTDMENVREMRGCTIKERDSMTRAPASLPCLSLYHLL